MKAEKPRFHTSIDTMMIVPFDAIVRGNTADLSGLLFPDCEATVEELQAAFDTIKDEYEAELSKRPEIANANRLHNRMMAIKMKYDGMMQILAIAEKHHDENIVAAAKVWGYDLPTRNHIPACRKKVNQLRTKFDELVFESNQKENKPKKQVDLQESAYMIERFYNSQIDLSKTTVKKWLIIENQYIKDIKAHENKSLSKSRN